MNLWSLTYEHVVFFLNISTVFITILLKLLSLWHVVTKTLLFNQKRTARHFLFNKLARPRRTVVIVRLRINKKLRTLPKTHEFHQPLAPTKGSRLQLFYDRGDGVIHRIVFIL